LDLDGNEIINKIEFCHGLDILQNLIFRDEEKEHVDNAEEEDARLKEEEEERYREMTIDDWIV
jgi:hypothetical protein